MVPITTKVHSQAGDKIVQPSSNRAGQRRRHETATKIVEDLPSGQWRERILPPPCAGTGNSGKDPAGNLPIPANPAMPAIHVLAVTRRVFLVQLHIAQQTRACVTPFHKIVAEDPVLGKSSVEHPLERIHVIDPLADEGAFTEHVLVNIGDGACVRVDARLAPAQSRVPRPVRAGQAHGHTWLQDAVPLRDTLLIFVVPRTIQRVCHSSHELPRRVARQLRIRVKGDHVLHVR